MDHLAQEVDRRVAEIIGALAAGVAHDFNNFLLGILGNAGLAREMLPPGAPIADLLESIIQSSRHGADLHSPDAGLRRRRPRGCRARGSF
jgi:signal transduction histidine kinase